MKKITLLFLGMMLMTGIAFAKPVDSSTARRVAETYMAANGMKDVTALVDITSQTSFSEFYVFAAEDGGFILVSADDCVIPVLGYSVTSRFETKDIPENIQGWLDGYEQEIRWWKQQNNQGAEAASQWEMLLDGTMPPMLLTTAVSPLMTTTWNQEPYYNNLCPYHSASGQRSVTGCVATATAQVMKYYNHPTTGYGSHTYTSDRTINGVNYNFPNLTADFGNTTYQWSLMPNALTGTSSSTQVNAVATLMYHIGVADEMSYSPEASGAHNYNYDGTILASSQTSLMKYFKYRPDMAALARADYSDDAYSALLRAELDQSRPILYSGSNTSGGHSFVFDGYNNAGQFHVNWGWGSYHDGYFTMGSLNPGVGGTGGNSSGTYNLYNVALIGIRPNTNWSTSGTTTITATSTGNGTVSGGGNYAFGDTVRLYATANAGYRFSGWSDGSKFNPRELIANGGSYSFTANFEALSGDTLHYCPGNYNINSYGLSSGTTWGIKLPASVLPSGHPLSAVQLYVVSAGTYNLTVYTGASLAATASVTFSANDVDQWKSIPLTTPVTATGDIWIVFTSSADYPASFTYGSGVEHSFLWSSNLYEVGNSWGVTAMIKGIFGTGSTQSCPITNFPYTESFDAGLGCWTAIDNNNDNSTWRVANNISSDVTPHSGSAMAASFSWQGSAMQADEYLVSPQITLPAGQTATLLWWFRVNGSYPLDKLAVKVSTTGNAVSNFTTTLIDITPTATNGDWTQQSIDLSAYAGQSIYLAFHHHDSYDANYLLLDDIVIETIVDPCPTITTYPYNESFDTGLGCWTPVDNNSDSHTWMAISNIDNSILPHSGAAMAASFSWQGSAMQADEYLLSPHFTLPAGQTVTLSWWFRVNGSYPLDKLAVKLSTTGNAVSNFTTTLVDITPTSANGSWTQRTIDLSAYAGQSIYLAFHHHDSYDANYLLVDDIQITAVAPPTQYTLTVVSNNPAWGNVSGGGTYNAGATATLTATPNTGYRFVYWNDGDTNATRTVTVTDNATYIANFEVAPPTQYTLTVVSNNPAWGTVTGGGTYNEGTTVTLTATANAGYHFVQWQDGNTNATRTVTVTGNATYTATFEANPPNQYTLTVVSNNPAWGTVTGSGTYNEGATVTLTATANAGYHFIQWNDGNTNATRTVTVTGNATYTATFEANPPNQYTLTVVSNNPAWGTVTGGGTYNEGTTVTLTATANAGYHFVQWQDGNTNATRTVTVTGNATYTATFEANPPNQYTITVVSNNPAWGTVSGGGTYNEGATATLTATANAGYHFVQWQDGNTNATRTVTVTDDATYTATFAENPPVTDTCTVTVFPYFEGFEDINTLGCWMIHDADGDGNGWLRFGDGTQNYGYASHYALGSASWNQTAGPLTPDNWLMTPSFALPVNQQMHLKWYAKGQDANDYAENYSVYVSTTGNNISDFTIAVYTGTTTSSWIQHDVDLSAYAGSTIYIAFRHYNTTDMFYLLIDNVEITDATSQPTQYTLTVVSNNPAWGTVTGGGTYNEGATATLTATANAGYHFVEWNDHDTNATRTVTVTGNATYTATFAQNEGIDGVDMEGISLYPNPASDRVHLVVTEQAEVSVMDITGRTVLKQAVMAGENIIDVSKLSDGLYFVKVGARHTSFIIQH